LKRQAVFFPLGPRILLLLFGADYGTMVLSSSTLAWRHKNAVRVFVWWVMIERVMNTTTRWRAAFYLGAAQSGFAERKSRRMSAQSGQATWCLQKAESGPGAACKEEKHIFYLDTRPYCLL